MSASNTFENDLLKLIFNASAIANLADNAGVSPNTDLYVSLHVADPAETGDQSTNEANYTSYARAAVSRDINGWTVMNNEVTNTAIIDFPMATGGTSTVTHFGIGTDASGTGKLLFKGALDQSLAVSNQITPSFNIGDLKISVD